MHGRPRWWFGLAAAVLLLPALVRADTGSSDKNPDERSQSHIPIPLHGMDLQKALAERVQVLQETTETNQFFEDFLKDYRIFVKDQKSLEQFVELLNKGRLPSSLNDPRLQRIQDDYNNHKKKEFTPEQQNKIHQIFEKVHRNSQELNDQRLDAPRSPTLDGNGGAMSPGESPSRSQMQPTAGPTDHPAIRDPGPADSEIEPNFFQQLTQRLAEQVGEGSWADSPALMEAVRELKRPHLEIGDWSGLDENSWSGKLAGFSRSVMDSRFWPEVDWSRLGKLPSPKFPARQIDVPKVKVPWKTPSATGFPKISLPSPSSLNRGLGLLWVALIILLVVIVWKFLRAQSQARSPGGRGWKLGPWPVSPEAIASREELILAFEYLSLLKLGPAALSRNHLALAEALAGKKEEGRHAARHLAALYELARYAPERNPISDDALIAARRELCYLAETARA
jgi:hypothetical protein